MAKFVTIGERLSTTAPAVNKAFMERDPEPILKRAKQQLDAGAVYLDVNIGPADGYGEDLMKWAVQLLQSEFDNVPLALDTSNKAAIEAGISVYNRSKGKPIVNSADAAGRIENIDLAAANDAIDDLANRIPNDFRRLEEETFEIAQNIRVKMINDEASKGKSIKDVLKEEAIQRDRKSVV